MSASKPLLLQTSAIRTLEHRLVPHLPLMERAGASLFHFIYPLAKKGGTIVFLCGPGNNGGDGFIAAHLLRQQGLSPIVIAAPSSSESAYRARTHYITSGGTLYHDLSSLNHLTPPLIVIDGCFGIGLTRPIASPYDHWISWANERADYRIAIDIPSGLHADTGNLLGKNIFRAHHTLTFIAAKPGLFTADGPDYAGKIIVNNLSLDNWLFPFTKKALAHFLSDPFTSGNDSADPETSPNSYGLLVNDYSIFSGLLRERPHNVHKGNFGHVLIIGGVTGMKGALHLAARAALFLGAGKVSAYSLSIDSSYVDPIAPEILWPNTIPSDPTVIAIGPGLGKSETALQILTTVIEKPLPLVLDADALNLIAMNSQLFSKIRARQGATLLTPHPAEAARLLKMTTHEVQRDRISAAIRLSRMTGGITILKGCGTVVALPSGAWAINHAGHGGMASGGVGDVLTGILAALIAQNLPPPAAAIAAVYLHAAAAEQLAIDHLAGPIGLTASEIIYAARSLLNQWCQKTNPLST